MKEVELFRKRNLPHWDVPGATYFITGCLSGSIPAQGLIDLDQYQRQLRKRKLPEEMTKDEKESCLWKLQFARIDHWLDLEPAVRHFDDPKLASIVFDSLLFFAGERYEVYALVVMPSHFHWVFKPLDGWVQSLSGPQSPRERIMKGIKSYIARECHKNMVDQTQFWQDETYDHWIRSQDELERIIYYIEQNPVVAKLVNKPEEFRYSSSRIRRDLGLPDGAQIPKLSCRLNERSRYKSF